MPEALCARETPRSRNGGHRPKIDKGQLFPDFPCPARYPLMIEPKHDEVAIGSRRWGAISLLVARYGRNSLGERRAATGITGMVGYLR